MKLIIVIDGVSSSGRTSLVKEFISSDIGATFQSYHIDEFTKQLPSEMWRRCADSDPGWAEIGISFNDFLAEQASQHDKIIADLFYKLSKAREHLYSTIHRSDLFFVQLYCELKELEKREISRRNRRKGLARSQFTHLLTMI